MNTPTFNKQVREIIFQQLALKAGCCRNALMMHSGYKTRNLCSNGHFFRDFYTFSHCVKKLQQKPLTLNVLNQAHRVLHPDDLKFGSLRNNNVIIGTRDNDTHHLGVKSGLLKQAIREWIKQSNLSTFTTVEVLHVLKNYFKLISIHPYVDGNGRLARAYLCSKGYETCCFILFIQSLNGLHHNELVRCYDKTGFEKSLEELYQLFIDFLKRLESETDKIINQKLEYLRPELQQTAGNTKLKYVREYFGLDAITNKTHSQSEFSVTDITYLRVEEALSIYYSVERLLVKS